MNNKVLINLYVPQLDFSFDIFIPVNEMIWKVKKLILKSVSDLTGTNLDMNSKCILINKITSEIYDNNAIIHSTNIRNSTELVIIIN